MDEMDLKLSMRELAYSLFGRAFVAEPHSEFVTLLCGEAIDALIREQSKTCSWAKELRRELDSLRKLGNEQALERLKADYTVLFLGPLSLPAPIWESVYVTKRNELYTEETLKVRDVYRANGFSTEPYPFTPDDHVGVEMSYMAALAHHGLGCFCENNDAGMTNALRASHDFLEEHLNRWLKPCGEKMLNTKRCGQVYPCLMAFAAQFCHHDQCWLDAYVES